MTPSGIDPVTFRFVAQCLNHCTTACPRSTKVHTKNKDELTTIHNYINIINAKIIHKMCPFLTLSLKVLISYYRLMYQLIHLYTMVKSSLCMPWRHKSHHHSFLTSALDGGNWPISCPSHFTPRQAVFGIQWIKGWLGHTDGLDTLVHRQISCP
jgi:hypothetical protein